MLDNKDVFVRVGRTPQGRDMIRELERELLSLDVVSRRMTGDHLERNTLKRAILSDILERFKEIEQRKTTQWTE